MTTVKIGQNIQTIYKTSNFIGTKSQPLSISVRLRHRQIRKDIKK